MKGLLIYFIIQLWSNSIGITALYSLKPEIENKIKLRGYKINKNYSKAMDIFKLFVPFYYMFKGLSLIYSKYNVDLYVESLRRNKRVVVDRDFIKENKSKTEEEVVDNVFKKVNQSDFTNNEKYVYRAENRKIYDKFEENELNPFVSADKNANTDVKNVTVDDLVKYVYTLPTEEIEEIQEGLKSYVLAKKNTSEIK